MYTIIPKPQLLDEQPGCFSLLGQDVTVFNINDSRVMLAVERL